MKRPFALGALLAACTTAPNRDAQIPRVPWSSLQETLHAVAAWPYGTRNDAPLAIHVVIPDEHSDTDFTTIHAAFRARGYAAPHADPTMLATVTDMHVRLCLADPVELDGIDTRIAAEPLWMAGIPFCTTGGNSMTIILPRRAIPAAKVALQGFFKDSDWNQSVAHLEIDW